MVGIKTILGSLFIFLGVANCWTSASAQGVLPSRQAITNPRSAATPARETPASAATPNAATPTNLSANKPAADQSKTAPGRNPASESNSLEGSSATPSVPGYRIPPNTILETILPLTPASRISVQSSKNPMVYTVREAIAVPYGFNPTNLNKILIISGTSDGEGSSIRAMRSFTNIALRLGWMVVAADGPNGKPPQDNPPWRWAMLSTVLDHIHKVWPESRKWPVACAGFSGGAKWSAITGAILSQKGYNLVGVFMGGCNQDMASEAARLYWPATKFKKVPMFLSSGSEDTVATPSHHVAVKESMLDSGFYRVRLESYKGGHDLDPQSLRTALYWFFEEVIDQKPSPQPTGNPPAASDSTSTNQLGENEEIEAAETPRASPTSSQ
ncbi:MAG: hypothetical protein ACO1QB_11085 [Verrucomicrobiales bacterium]